MIAVDTSALIAILLDEEDAARYVRVLESAPGASMSVASYVELCAVMKHERGPEAIGIIDRLIDAIGCSVLLVGEAQVPLEEAFGTDCVLGAGKVVRQISDTRYGGTPRGHALLSI